MLLIIVLGLRQAIGPAILIVPLPILTLMINNTFIFNRYGAVFNKVPLDVSHSNAPAPWLTNA